MTFKSTKLWRDAFDQREHDDFADQRARLASQLLTMRDHVATLVSYIPVDCKHLTVHDITHLDALWESAQQIIGDRWNLNPAEAFVFGAAVLIHDAGLTTLSYPKGKEGIKASEPWKDIVAYSYPESQSESQADLTPEEEADLLFSLLREMHAKQAESLCQQSWELSEKGSFYLIDDTELREAFGETIGRIAGSHHWEAERVRRELTSQGGGSPKLPAEWTVNECKLGCLIRCADAAQVDRTRAPLTLYAALGPRGYANLHWRAQSKLNRPLLKGDAIHFRSSSSFMASESDAWWIAFDLANVLENELRASNAILTDIGEETFAAQRVAGAESTDAFSKHVQTNKWRPIDASVRVTDPLRLARTLGGKNLYGESQLVPFRELIQNSADAIRARRALEERGNEFGKISVTIEQHPSNDDMCLAHVDDNGIGMSERVLSTTLVDFGKSLWNSNLIRDEFPGLKAAKVKHIGKFGIGFFSIFEVAQTVRVISKRYDEGLRECRTLDFKGLATRPLLRETNSEEIPRDVNTRITLSLRKDIFQEVSSVRDFNEELIETGLLHKSVRSRNLAGFKEAIQGMCCFLDIDVNFLDKRNGDTFTHSANVYEKDAATLISEMPIVDRGSKNGTHFSPAEKMRPLKSSNGDAFGRAALDIDAVLSNRISRPHDGPRGYISVGGIIGPNYAGRKLHLNNGVVIPYFGVIEGKTERAARDVSSIIAPEEAVNEWLIAQINSLDKDVLRTSEVMKIASFALMATGIEVDLPFAFHSGEVKSVSAIAKVLKERSQVLIPLSWRFEKWLEVVGYNSLRPEYFEARLSESIIVLADGTDRILDEEEAKNIRRAGGGKIDQKKLLMAWPFSEPFIKLLNLCWRCECSISLALETVFSTKIASLSDERWVLKFEKV